MKITLDETRVPRDGFGKDHLLSRVTLGKVYVVKNTHQQSVQVVDNQRRDLWISGTKLKRYFKEVK